MRVIAQSSGQAQSQHGLSSDATKPSAYMSQFTSDGLPLDARFMESEMDDLNSFDFLDFVNQAYSPGTDDDGGGYLADLNTPDDISYPLLSYDMHDSTLNYARYLVAGDGAKQNPTGLALPTNMSSTVAAASVDASKSGASSENEQTGDILKQASAEIENLNKSDPIGTTSDPAEFQEGKPKVTLTLKPRKSWTAPPEAAIVTAESNVENVAEVQRETGKKLATKTRRRHGNDDGSRYEQLSLPPPKQRKEVDVESITERNKRNAIQARVNRQKKKEYMETLQEEMELLQSQNKELRSTNENLEKRVTDMTMELHYLRNVLANESSLSSLLRTIGNTNGVRLRTNVITEMAPQEHNLVGGGVCLHVDKDDVSVEFCAQCSKMAKESAT